MYANCPECGCSYQADSEFPCCLKCMEKKYEIPVERLLVQFKCHGCSFVKYNAREYLANILITGAPLCSNCDKEMEMLETVLI